MPLARLHVPFDHPDWVYELKLDGFRALAYVERGGARLVSRNGNVLRSFSALTNAVAGALARDEAVLDGEIVHLGADGAPQFYDFIRRRTPQHFFAFDLLWLDGRDLRGLPLLERKRLLRAVVPPQPSQLLYVDHVERDGVGLYQAACQRDLEGIVAKLAHGLYTPEATSWVKVKNSSYSQAERQGGLLRWSGISRFGGACEQRNERVRRTSGCLRVGGLALSCLTPVVSSTSVPPTISMSDLRHFSAAQKIRASTSRVGEISDAQR